MSASCPSSSSTSLRSSARWACPSCPSQVSQPPHSDCRLRTALVRVLLLLIRVCPMHRSALCAASTPDELQLVFTSISRSDPSRPYLLSVYIDERNDYAVQQCDPAIERLPELLAEVNRSVVTAAGKEEVGDFGVFVMRVRQEFYQLAQAEVAALAVSSTLEQ